MNNLIQRKLDAFDGIAIFGGNNPLVPLNARAATLYTVIGNATTALRTHGADQDGGNAEFRSGTGTRRMAADALIAQMRPINQMARGLPRDEYPGVRELFRMPQSNGYAALISRAQAFIDAIGPIKATFVDCGLPADFDEQLAEKLADIPPATVTRSTGKAVQVAGTAGLTATATEGMKALHELDSILSYQYRNNAPLLAAWKSACHVERDPEPEDERQTPSAPLLVQSEEAKANAVLASSNALSVPPNGRSECGMRNSEFGMKQSALVG